MPRVTFHHKNGKQISVQAENLSVMEAAVQADIAEIEGACGGSLACATCHIHLSGATFEQLHKTYPLSEEEADMLELAYNRQNYSRLSCQILLKSHDPDLDVFIP